MSASLVRSSTPARTRVHITARRPGPSVGYFDQIIADEDSEIEFRFAGGPLASFDVDVVHTLSADVEHLAGPSSTTEVLRARNASSLVAQLRRHRVALVQTVLAGAPHARPSLARRILNAATAAWIVPDSTIRTPSPERTTIIPVAHYRERYTGYPRNKTVPGRLLCFDSPDQPELARRLIGVTRASQTAGLSLRVIGDDADRLRPAVQEENRRTKGEVSTTAGKVSDGMMLHEIDHSELVIQPQVERFDDYKRVLLALSRGRAVLVPAVESMVQLAEEVGDGWLHVAHGPMTAAVIDQVLATSRASTPSAEPDLTARDPHTIAAAYAAVYRSARRS